MTHRFDIDADTRSALAEQAEVTAFQGRCYPPGAPVEAREASSLLVRLQRHLYSHPASQSN